MWKMRLTFALIALAIVISVASFGLSLMGGDFDPLTGASVEILDDEVHPGGTASKRLTGCTDRDVTIAVYSFWIAHGERSHLGDAGASILERGCIDTVIEVTVPALPPGMWRVSLVVLVSTEHRLQTVSVVSNEVRVAD